MMPSDDSNTPFSIPGQQAPMAPRSKRPGKKVVIGGVALLVIVIAAVIGGLLLRHKNNSYGGANADVYYDRASYNRASLSTGIGDPEAVIMKAVGAPVAYNGKPTVQACNLLTLDELHSQGYHLIANPVPGAMTRTFFDGKGSGQLHPEPADVSGAGATSANECAYGLTDQTAITIDVFSTNYYPADNIQAAIDSKFQKQQQTNGVDTYLYKGNEALAYLLQYQSVTTTVWFSLNGGNGNNTPNAAQSKSIQTWLNTIAKNMIAQAASPTGLAQLSYSSPVFSKSFADACSLADASDFKTAIGVDSSPLVQQQMAASTGVVNFRDSGGPNVNYAYLDNECMRLPADNGTYPSLALSINTKSFTSDTPAKYEFASDRKDDANQTSVTTVVGDETAIYGDQADLHNAMAFRKGRFVVDVSVTLPGTKPPATPQQIIQILTPLAQKIASKLPQD